jgi:hypothetical protein
MQRFGNRRSLFFWRQSACLADNSLHLGEAATIDRVGTTDYDQQ